MQFVKKLFSSCTNPKFSDDYTSIVFERSGKVDAPCREATNWNHLPNEMKQMIISKMEYFTRLNLSQCSKSDFANVKRVKLSVYSIGIVGDSENNKQCIDVAVWCDMKSRNVFKIIEEDRKCRIVIERIVDKVVLPTRQIYRQETCETIAFKIIKFFLKHGDGKLKRVNIGMESPILRHLFDNHLQHVDNFYIDAKNGGDILWWLDRMGPLRVLTINHRGGDEVTNIIDHFNIKNCTSSAISFYAGPLFWENELLKMDLVHIKIRMDDRSFLTTRSFNKFIQRWRRGEMKCDFRSMTVRNIRTLDEVVLLEGLQAEEWDDEFRKKEKWFSDLFVSKYIGEKSFFVRSMSGDMEATLHYSEFCINFVVTFKKSEGRLRVPYTLVSL